MEKNINEFVYSTPADLQQLLVNKITPNGENIDKLMRNGKFFEEPGILKIWLPDSE